MRPALRSALVLALVACSRPDAQSREVVGTLVVDGKPVIVVACRPDHAVHVYVELVTASGVLRFEDAALYWNPDREALSRGPKLVCTKLDRSWGGGTRMDGSSYWRGTLDFACGAVTGSLSLDCGNITPEERQSLDDNRRKALGSGS